MAALIKCILLKQYGCFNKVHFSKNKFDKKMILIPLLIFHLVQAIGRVKGFVNVINE